MARSGTRTTARQYRMMQILLWCLLLAGPAIILHAVLANHRDRPSLLWPTTPGVIVQSESVYHSRSRHSYYNVLVTYSYQVEGRKFVGHRVTLWNPDLKGGGVTARAFVNDHPVHSTMDVHYDPAHPEDAVLIPGADESGNRLFIWDGALLCVAVPFLIFWTRKFFPHRIAVTRAAEAHIAARPKTAPALPHAFVSYEPAGRLKLNCFPDKDCVEEILGHRGKKLRDWKPDDCMIDAEGRVYRFAPRAGQKSYDLEPTGETWSPERLLELAENDARALKHDPTALNRQVNDAPPEKKMAVLMKGIDDLSAGPSLRKDLAIGGFILFLVLFFLAVAYIAGKGMMWLWK